MKFAPMWIGAFWRYPKLVLAYMTLVNVMLFFDRGAIASVLPSLHNAWNLSKTMEGIIQSAFVIGFMTASPVWANFANRYLMAVGLFTFAISSALLGTIGAISRTEDQIWGYYVFVIFRVILGIGEASFVPLSVSIIDDISPASLKSIYMAIFMVTCPVGIAAGYGVSGVVTAYIGYWQLIFFVQAIIVAVFAVFMVFVPLHGHRERMAEVSQIPGTFSELQETDIPEDTEDITLETDPTPSEVVTDAPPVEEELAPPKKYNVFTVLVPLAKNVIYVSIVATSTQYFGVLGALVFWAPTYIEDRLLSYDLSKETRITLSNLGFSAIIIVCSIIGTAIGGILLDKTGGSTGYKGIARALFWSLGYLALAFPVGLLVYLIDALPVWLMFTLLGIAILFLMMLTSPFQCALVSALPQELRHFGMSYQIFFLHALGDFPSPFLFGVIADASSMKWAMVWLWSLLGLAIIFILPGALWALRRHKRGDIIM